jgi:hypothetical protein
MWALEDRQGERKEREGKILILEAPMLVALDSLRSGCGQKEE